LDEDKIQIKGISEGLLVTVKDNPWNDAKNLVAAKIDENPDFFHGAKIVLDVGEIPIKAAELGKMRDDLSSRAITLTAVLSKSSATLQNAQALGISTYLGVRQDYVKNKKNNNYFEGDAAVWVERTLRAGYKIETKCHVIVMGDVNPGAEIISAGNIMVWGRLSGSVHAGADGNVEARIMALELEATNLQIASLVAVPIIKKRKKQPEIAYISKNEIIIEGWDIRKNNRGDL
jgi:septum site-determining protein MinC